MGTKLNLAVGLLAVILFAARTYLTAAIDYQVPDLTGKTFVVTGCTGGIGLETARALGAHGATVVMANRNMSKSELLAPAGEMLHRELDLASFASVRAFAKGLLAEGRAVDAVILNAATTMDDGSLSADGVDMQYQVNHLSHFLLANLLAPALRDGARLVFVSSMNHYLGRLDSPAARLAYSAAHRNADPATRMGGMQLYSDTKLMNSLTAVDMAARHPRLVATHVHPGLVETGLDEDGHPLAALLVPLVRRLLARSAAAGALTQLRVATDPALAGGAASGRYFSDGCIGAAARPCEGLEANPATRDTVLRAWLWETSEAIVGGFVGAD
jgi:NAD(P)-dependent dehydrogenase (short-subunit alcohol dehydrogenase family)